MRRRVRVGSRVFVLLALPRLAFAGRLPPGECDVILDDMI